MKLFLALLGVIAPIAGAVLWWMKSSERREKKQLLKEIEELEDEVSEALARNDMDTLAKCNAELIRLRRKDGLLKG